MRERRVSVDDEHPPSRIFHPRGVEIGGPG